MVVDYNILEAAPRNTRARRWVVVCNNYDQEDEACLKEFADIVEFAIFAKEVGKQGTPHLQGFVHFKKQMYFTQVAAMMPFWNLRMAKGTDWENYVYCSKQDPEAVIYGEIPDEKYSRDEKKVKTGAAAYERTLQLALQGRLLEIQADHLIRHYMSIKRLCADTPVTLPVIDGALEHLWIWGAPGCGKSRFARFLAQDKQFNKNSNKWWCGYQQESEVLIDDFDKSGVVLGHHLKLWGDRYPFTGEVKGGSVQARPQRIIITSNYSMDQIGWDDETLGALKRRYKEIGLINNYVPEDFEQLARDNELRFALDETATLPMREDVDGVSQELEERDYTSCDEIPSFLRDNQHQTPPESSPDEEQYMRRHRNTTMGPTQRVATYSLEESDDDDDEDENEGYIDN